MTKFLDSNRPQKLNQEVRPTIDEDNEILIKTFLFNRKKEMKSKARQNHRRILLDFR